jgi:hypothetical protein
MDKHKQKRINEKRIQKKKKSERSLSTESQKFDVKLQVLRNSQNVFALQKKNH